LHSGWEKAAIKVTKNSHGSTFTHRAKQGTLDYDGRSESKECFAIQRYFLIIEKKQNMQVLSHTFTYFSTFDIEALVVP
jgi:hypothetical protein